MLPALLVLAGLLLPACSTTTAMPRHSPGATGGAMSGGAMRPDVVLTKSPTCSCCTGHQAYLEGNGFHVQVQETDDIPAIKDGYRIPPELRSCHTSMVGRYVVEGHVPLAAIEQLLAERPDIDGIALPGMPPGSPGMGGQLEGPLVVLAFDDGAVVGELGRY